MTFFHYISGWMVCSWLYAIICQVERSVHDFMSLYVRLNVPFVTLFSSSVWMNGLFMTFISLFYRINGSFMTFFHYMSGWMVCSWLYAIICQVERSVHDLISLYVRLNGLFMTYVIICQVEWSVHDFMSLYVRLNGSFVTLFSSFVWMNGLFES